MSPAMRDRSSIKDERRHNLGLLNAGRQRPRLAPSLTAIERERGLRFIVEARQAVGPQALADAIWAAHGLVAQVKPLFGSVDLTADANGMDRFALVTLAGLAQRDIAEDVFDVAGQLAATPGIDLISVEPDLPHAVYHGTPEVAIAGDLNPCEVDAAVPADRAWHLRTLRVPDAWALTPPHGGRRFGRGSVIGHIDTGWAPHDDFVPGNVRLDLGHDFIDDDPDPHDPLEAGSLLGGPSSPGHGTATGSVLVGRGDGGEAVPNPAQVELWGVAPGATLVPIRAIRFVFFIFDSDVAAAIQFAADQGCHVISMSLGGIPTAALEAAVNYAVARNVIVCAAAGNCLPTVSVAPAIYPNCLAVGGCNSGDGPWPFSSRGEKVAVSAPAENVWAARRGPNDASTAARSAGQGTSFAVASVAGIAALWLAFHGRDTLLAKYQGTSFLHHVFQHLLRQTARPSPLLPTDAFGSGIADAQALLSAPLPAAGTVPGGVAVADLAVLTPPEVIAAMYDGVDAATVRARLATLTGAGVAGVDEQARAWGPELIHILAQDQAAYRAFGESLAAPVGAAPAADDGRLATEIGRLASRRLRAAVGV